MKTNIKTLAEKAGLELTSKGNLELGSNDQGDHGQPGSQACNSAVAYYLTPSGDVRAVIDNRSGSNQGYIEWQSGDITRMDGADLDEAIQLAQDHIKSLDDADLMRAWRIASSEARATMRKIEAGNATNEGTVANARLIAAAPELFSALTQLYEETADYIRTNHLGDVHHNLSMQIAREALNKAKGE